MQTFDSFNALVAAQSETPLVSDMSVFNGSWSNFERNEDHSKDEYFGYQEYTLFNGDVLAYLILVADITDDGKAGKSRRVQVDFNNGDGYDYEQLAKKFKLERNKTFSTITEAQKYVQRIGDYIENAIRQANTLSEQLADKS